MQITIWMPDFMTRTIAPYGTWASPITPLSVAGNSKRFGALHLSTDALYWSEGRPEDQGRTVIVKCDAGGQKTDMIPPQFCARSKVHEYGGGEFSVWNDKVFFVNDSDQDIYEVAGEGAVHRLTDHSDWRFSDMCYDPHRNRLVVVAEHHQINQRLPRNLLVSIALESHVAGEISIMAEGRDFYASPRISPCGQHLVYLCWDLPHMPWEAAELWMAEMEAQDPIPSGEKVAGGGGTCVFQPQWSADSCLIFVWDKSGWGNLYALTPGGAIEPLFSWPAEFGQPQWVFGMTSYALVGKDRLIARYFKDGVLHLGILELNSRQMREIDVLSLDIAGIEAIVADDSTAYMLACFHHRPPAICSFEIANGNFDIVQASSDVSVAQETLSVGELVTFSSLDDRTCFGIYYAPDNEHYQAPEDELPPMIISAHGGPTAMADRGLKLKIQYWTSRGFAFFDVDYTGSFGYGSAYRRALDGFWGIRDVEDVVAGARALAAQGRADSKRLLISGSSAGGYTVLMALVSSDVFAAGAAYYGISDMFKLQQATHKFELGYIDTLMGSVRDTQHEIFTARSPICNADRIISPVIFFQGEDDRVVPPEQSTDMAKTLEKNGVPVAYVEFAGEGHGFRDARNIETALTNEYTFYARVLGLANSGQLPDMEILNFGDV
jgi:dipeptidyl aminopeptidase/acylaminoacyl peptidase